MLLSVMAEQSNASVEEIAEAGVERARAGNLHRRVLRPFTRIDLARCPSLHLPE
jgi:hypothetical protein